MLQVKTTLFYFKSPSEMSHSPFGKGENRNDALDPRVVLQSSDHPETTPPLFIGSHGQVVTTDLSRMSLECGRKPEYLDTDTGGTRRKVLGGF